MLKKGITANKPALPETVAGFVENVCQKQGARASPICPPNMILPFDSGNGRSRMARIIAKRYFDAKACAFSSRDILLEFTFKETVQHIYEVDAEIQANAEYANDYRGVIAFCIDALMPHLGEAAGNKFFELAEKVKRTAMLIIYVPADCSRKHIDLITGKIGISMKAFPAIAYSDEDLARFFCGFLPSAINPSKTSKGSVAPKNMERVIEYISQNVRRKTIKNIKEAAESTFFDDDAREKLFGKPARKKESGVIIQ